MASGCSQSDAYRNAYTVKPDIKSETVNKRSSELMANGAITGRVAELRKAAEKLVAVSLESHLHDLYLLRESAVKDAKWAAAINAEIARGKASGVYMEAKNNGNCSLNIQINLGEYSK